ncbi:hypothetical protein CALCODRAFT_510489 [Calocera cornea HHB12733]|uniref:Uncharacterized protein n=1 Tax=Calocera cornea HHB12733 TaxID=1353952 RepID=A0A165EGF5_9BASI|nr:hypothetical protein CALCODRAFT_510489 [Calocera cornea HHB12733]
MADTTRAEEVNSTPLPRPRRDGETRRLHDPYPAFGTQPTVTQASTISAFTEPSPRIRDWESPRRGSRKVPPTVHLQSALPGQSSKLSGATAATGVDRSAALKSNKRPVYSREESQEIDRPEKRQRIAENARSGAVEAANPVRQDGNDKILPERSEPRSDRQRVDRPQSTREAQSSETAGPPRQRLLPDSGSLANETRIDRKNIAAENERLRLWADKLRKAEQDLKRQRIESQRWNALEQKLENIQSKLRKLNEQYAQSRVELDKKNEEILALRSRAQGRHGRTTTDHSSQQDPYSQPEATAIRSSPTLVSRAERGTDDDEVHSPFDGSDGEADDESEGVKTNQKSRSKSRNQRKARFQSDEEDQGDADGLPEDLKKWCIASLGRSFWSVMGIERSTIIPKDNRRKKAAGGTVVLIPDFDGPIDSAHNRRMRKEVVKRSWDEAQSQNVPAVQNKTEQNKKKRRRDKRRVAKLKLRKEACASFQEIHGWNPSSLLTEDVMSDEYSTSGEGNDEERVSEWREVLAQQAGVRLSHLENKYVVVWETVVPKFRSPGIDYVLHELDTLSAQEHKPIAIRAYLGAFHTRIPSTPVPSWTVGNGSLHKSPDYGITHELPNESVEPVSGISTSIRTKIDGCCLVSASWHQIESGIVFRHLKCGHHPISEVPDATPGERTALLQRINVLPEERIIDIPPSANGHDGEEVRSRAIQDETEEPCSPRHFTYQLDIDFQHGSAQEEQWNQQEGQDFQGYGDMQGLYIDDYRQQDYNQDL